MAGSNLGPLAGQHLAYLSSIQMVLGSITADTNHLKIKRKDQKICQYKDNPSHEHGRSQLPKAVNPIYVKYGTGITNQPLSRTFRKSIHKIL